MLAGRELRNVSAFRECPPEERPVVHCPVCKQEVVLKLGDERVHHFAHKPRPELLRCRLENPSAARHFNALVHLSKQLEPAVCRELKVLTWHGKEPMAFAQDWDEVRTEFPIGKRRADVALLRQGSPIALIEIYHTHEVDFDKQDELDAYGIPWIEVNILNLGTLGSAGDDDFGWTATLPLAMRAGRPDLKVAGPVPVSRLGATPPLPPPDPAPPRFPRDDALYGNRAAQIVAEALQGRDRLSVIEPDLPWQDGEARVFVEGWDRIETQVISRDMKIDLVFSRAGVDLGYLMMYTGEEMWEYPRRILQSSGVPWAEVDVLANFWPDGNGDRDPVWTPDIPLLVQPLTPDAGGRPPEFEVKAEQAGRHAAAQDRLVQELQRSGVLAIALPSSPEVELAPRVFAHGWDEVRVNYAIDNLYAHVALLRRGQPIAYIEIQSVYRLDNRRLEALERLGIPWIEVMASDVIGADDQPDSAWCHDRRLRIQAGTPIRERNEDRRASRDWTRWPVFDFRWLSSDFDGRPPR